MAAPRRCFRHPCVTPPSMAFPTSAKSRLSSWYARLAAFNVEDFFSGKRSPGPPRTVYINEPLPGSFFDSKGKVRREHVYTSNQVITSKYSLITFLPRNLLEQFRRIANIFFLLIAILQFFPKFRTIAPGAVLVPLLVVLTVTALKDGYEDFKRHQSDKRVNYGQVQVLTGGNWSNPNAMKGKAKTFIRGVLPSRNKSPTAEQDQGNDSTPSKPHWKQTFWEDVRVGDFVQIRNNQSFPADILICTTSEDENVAFVETMNMDGETNLKSRRGVPALSNLNTAQECADPQTSFRIQCERPDTDMYRLNANVTIDGSTSPVDLSMTLLRGTVLRNTEWVIGIVLFTGLDSKIVMNSGGTPSKRSKVERQMNPMVFLNLIFLAIMAIICAIADSSLEKKYFPLNAPWLYGDNKSDDNPDINGLVTWAFALLTFQAIVPISLYISMEFVRTCQAAFIYFDSDICYEKTNQATPARTWNLSDDLGQIEYIFSDKTGTLTQNSMLFKMCSIAGKAYRGTSVEVEQSNSPSSTSPSVAKFNDSDLLNDIQYAANNNDFNASILDYFFTVLSLCHTVLAVTDPESGNIEYKAQSPDEAALVQAASDVGFVFLGKDRETLSIRTPHSGHVEKYELLEILEFTSARKRMSVVLRRINMDSDKDEVLLLTKGADNVIFERLLITEAQEEMKRETEVHLREFASNGLRTLTLAYKTIPMHEYEAWRLRYQQATISLENREEQVDNVADELEQQLQLLGATAIEDRLQDGVPETIEDLKKAGIKIWVATGDKLETAIAIGRSTNLINPSSNIVIIRGGSRRPVHEQMINASAQFFPEQQATTKDQLASPSTEGSSGHHIPLQRINTGVTSIVGEDNGERPGGFVLVVDGSALLEAFADDENKEILLRLAILCDGVICCRVSPLQKALIVRLIKDGLGAMTLAIGDGANDVSMIQAADVGVGISGEEGLQAVNSSDFAIGQFRFLKKLLLVHGHWSYARNGVMILNFFYKNIVPVGLLAWFQIYDGWSANYVMDYIFILFWNSLWTIAPVIGVGLFDRFLDSRVLMDFPQLYRYGREGTWFGTKPFLVYMLDGVIQSAIIYFLILYTYTSPTSRTDGYDGYINEFSTTMAISAVLVVNLFTGFTAAAWTWWIFFAVVIGIIVQWVFTVIYSLISPGYAVTTLYGNYYYVFRSAYFWLCIPITVSLSLAPRLLYKAWKFGYSAGDLETFQLLQKIYPNQDLSTFLHRGPEYGAVAPTQRPTSSVSRVASSRHDDSRPNSFHSHQRRFSGRPSLDVRSGSRTDMATGTLSVDHGFGFAAEEHGVEMRRVQTNLSQRRMANEETSRTGGGIKRLPNKGKDAVGMLARGFMKRKAK
ncbi:hypothetical protein M413DRAFT_437796 [Hebeloma cylindrosporum]|uniref:Phospholipid-transporting ATPase n=1 Tax=Hebeloma cylindrosporum TaxID=76867 RepID=A0A0C2YFW7_HEBCY|nr:hypothetical protein M413DRAFT_437796 [Hebeloma cylindrosporum h7]